MKNLFLLFLFLFISSCKKENKITSELSTNADFEKAKNFSDQKFSDSAFYYFNLAKNSFLEKNDSIGVARALINMAFIQHESADFFGSIETSLEANKYIKNESDSIVKKILTSSYNNIANCSYSLKNFDNALKYYNKTLKYVDNDEDKYICYNNIGDMLLSMGKIKHAKKYLGKAILADSAVNYARAVNNFAKAKYLDDKTYNPLPEFYKALTIRKGKNDEWGKNSSYETLSTYYLDKDKNISLDFAQKMLNVATNNKSPDDRIIALERIISLDPKNYLKNFERLTLINDSLQTVRNKAKNQFAIVRYDVEQKNAENQSLKLSAVKNKINILYLSFGIAILLLALITGYFWNEKRKKTIRREKEQEKKLEVKNTELKYSKKVHDVVANGLYHMMIEIENNPEINKIKLLNDLEKMYEESRDISHESLMQQNFFEKFGKMINSYSTPEQKVLPAKYTENIWDSIPQYIQAELFYVVREILVNMKKHSEAKLAVLKFERNDTTLRITYSDNGKGIKNMAPEKGAGILNTENRIAAIGGDIIFEQNPNGGLIIKIAIPINS